MINNNRDSALGFGKTKKDIKLINTVKKTYPLCKVGR